MIFRSIFDFSGLTFRTTVNNARSPAAAAAPRTCTSVVVKRVDFSSSAPTGTRSGS